MCKKYNCTNHTEFIHEIHKDIINIISIASNTSLPHTSKKNEKKVIPGWNDHVKEHSERSKM